MCFYGSMHHRNLPYISGPVDEGKCPTAGAAGNIFSLQNECTLQDDCSDLTSSRRSSAAASKWPPLGAKIEPGKLVRGLAGVRSIKLRETGLTVEQINLLMAEILRSKVIRSLDLIDKNLSQADVETMIAAFNSLESLSLHYGTLIGATNMASFLAAMGSSPSSLKKLSLRNISLSHVEPGTLGSAVRGLTSLEITPAQQEAVGLFCNT